MVWLDSIYQLQYYNTPPGADCYCELIVDPYQLMLQSPVSTPIGTPTPTVYLYSADGITQIANITSSFDFVFYNYLGRVHFNARLKEFPTAMCANPCFVLRVSIAGTTFDKYTERYCVPSCCITPTSFTHEGQDIQAPSEDFESGVIAMGTPGNFLLNPVQPPVSDCGKPIITLTTWFDCYDSNHGVFYGVPGNVISGTADWGYKRITNLKGRIIRQAREINKEISSSCRLLRTESFRPWLLEGFEEYPLWKMEELEQGFHGNNITVNDYKVNRYLEYSGGTAFVPIYSCWPDIFKLQATLQDCNNTITFNCGECDTAGAGNKLVMSFNIQQQFIERYFDENKLLIGTDYDNLLAYYQQFGAVTDKTSQSGSPCVFEHAFTVDATNNVPNVFYINDPIARNKIYGQKGEEIPCSDEPLCTMPDVDFEGAVIEDTTCATPVIGTVTIEDMVAESMTITDAANWTQTANTSTKYQNSITLSLTTENTTLTGSGNYPIGGETIGYIEVAGRPVVNRFVQIDDINGVLVEAAGAIKFYGNGTATGTETTISFTVIYNL